MSLLVKAVGDKLLVYLCKIYISCNTIVFIGLLIKNKLPERPQKKEGAEGESSKNILLEQVWPLIPKYSDL